MVQIKVKNPPPMQETQIQSLGREDSLEKGMATHSRFLENPMDRGAWQAIVHGVKKSPTWLSDWVNTKILKLESYLINKINYIPRERSL